MIAEKSPSFDTVVPDRRDIFSWFRKRKDTQIITRPRRSPSIVALNTYSNLPDPGSKLGFAWKKFCSACNDWPGPMFYPPRNYSPHATLTDVLLSLAKLYVFGDRYDIASLRALVLYKMRRTLVALKLFPQRIPEIFLLVEYIYETTRKGDELRVMVTQFAGCMITALVRWPSWDSYIVDQPAFTAELVQFLQNPDAA